MSLLLLPTCEWRLGKEREGGKTVVTTIIGSKAPENVLALIPLSLLPQLLLLPFPFLLIIQ